MNRSTKSNHFEATRRNQASVADQTINPPGQRKSAIRQFAERRVAARSAIRDLGDFIDLSIETRRALLVGLEERKIDIRGISRDALESVPVSVWRGLAQFVAPETDASGKAPEIIMDDSECGGIYAEKTPRKIGKAITRGYLSAPEITATLSVATPKKFATDLSQGRKDWITWAISEYDQYHESISTLSSMSTQNTAAINMLVRQIAGSELPRGLKEALLRGSYPRSGNASPGSLSEFIGDHALDDTIQDVRKGARGLTQD